MASNRRRLGVALLLDRPLSDEIDGLRRAVGDPSLGRIPAHITLVPPVNVRAADLPAALAVLRAAAAAQKGPLRLTIGSVTSFLPANPVLFAAVGGELEGLRRLRDSVFRPPLERTLSWPWVPHVTLADGAPPERIEPAIAALADFAAVAELDRIVLLEEGSGRAWSPLADAALGPPARVGTGGLTLELTRGRLADPEMEVPFALAPSTLLHPIVVTGRREGRPVGMARAWADGSGGHVTVFVPEEHRRQGIGGHLLAGVEVAARRAGWDFPTLDAAGPCGFYKTRSRWSVPTRTPPTRTPPAS